MPLYMDEFLQLDAQAFDLLFMDAESGPRLMSFGLRAFQDYFLNDFVASSKPFDDLVAVDQAWKLGETVLSCQNAMLQALDAIEQQAMYDEVDLPKRQAAADAAAQKILEAKAHDENRKEAVGKWLRGEVDRLVSKSRDLRAKAASASEKAGCALYKVLGLLESHGYSDEFSQKLELWRQLDASQKAAYDVVNAPKDTTTFQETLADQCIGATSVHDTLLESTQVDGPSTQVDAVEASMQDDADIAMASQPDAELVLPDEADTLLHDPYGDVEEGDLEKDAEEGGGQDSNKAHTGEGGGQNDSHVAHTGEGGGQDSSKAHTGEGGGQNDSNEAHTGEGGGQNDSKEAHTGEGGGQNDSHVAHTGEGGGQNDSHVAHTGEGGGQNDSHVAHTGEGGGQNDSHVAHTGEGGGTQSTHRRRGWPGFQQSTHRRRGWPGFQQSTHRRRGWPERFHTVRACGQQWCTGHCKKGSCWLVRAPREASPG